MINMKKLNPMISIILAAVLALSPVGTSTVWAAEEDGLSYESCDSEEPGESEESDDSGESGESEESDDSEEPGESEESDDSEEPGESEESDDSEESGDSEESDESEESDDSEESGDSEESDDGDKLDDNDGSEQSSSDIQHEIKGEENSEDAAIGGGLLDQEQNPEPASLELEVADGDEFGSGYTYSSFEANISDSYEGVIDEDQLSVILRGLNDAEKDRTFNAINEYISRILSTGEYMKISGDYIDAEKFRTVENGYDQNHCWAATASNILWTTGFAQQAINPLTNNKFQNEDELLTYFSENFTDDAGVPENACDWFFYGPKKYGLTGVAGVAQLKNNKTFGLLPDMDSNTFLRNILNNASAMSSLYSLASTGMGVLVRWLINGDNGGYNLSNNAHWATVSGVVYDSSKESVFDSIKAIVISDSDNDPYNKATISSRTTEEKLANKRGQTNSYTVYRVSYNEGLKAWLIDNFHEGYGVITHLYGLMDSDKKPEGGKENDTDERDGLFSAPVLPNSKVPEKIRDYVDALNDGRIEVDEETKEVYIFVENTVASENQEDMNSRVFTEADLEVKENISALREYMTTKRMPVYLMNDGVVDVSKNYPVYINAPETMLYNLMLDDIMIPFDAFRIDRADGTLSKLVINKEFLMKLPKGRHTIKISVQGSDIPTVFEIEVV